ncbi:hypothetical protein PQX77_017379, partial [Marasmius sp. AFHP31]
HLEIGDALYKTLVEKKVETQKKRAETIRKRKAGEQAIEIEDAGSKRPKVAPTDK